MHRRIVYARQHCVTIASTLCHHCVTIASPLRQHCGTIASPLRHHCVNIASTLRQHCVNIASPLRHHCVTARQHCVNIALQLVNIACEVHPDIRNILINDMNKKVIIDWDTIPPLIRCGDFVCIVMKSHEKEK